MQDAKIVPNMKMGPKEVHCVTGSSSGSCCAAVLSQDVDQKRLQVITLTRPLLLRHCYSVKTYIFFNLSPSCSKA